MFPLRTFVGYKHHTPLILGYTVVNPNIDDNRYLQRCLILASEGGHKIIANRKISDASVYNKWWKQHDKYKVFGVSLLKVSLNVFKITLLPEYNDNSKNKYDLFTSSQVYKPKVNGAALSLCIVNDIRAEGKKFPSTFCTSRI